MGNVFVTMFHRESRYRRRHRSPTYRIKGLRRQEPRRERGERYHAEQIRKADPNMSERDVQKLARKRHQTDLNVQEQSREYQERK